VVPVYGTADKGMGTFSKVTVELDAFEELLEEFLLLFL
jgi:hypothetical protein